MPRYCKWDRFKKEYPLYPGRVSYAERETVLPTSTTNYLKIDLSKPDPYVKRVWLPLVHAATPFANADAQYVKMMIRDATGVVQVEDQFYVVKVAS